MSYDQLILKIFNDALERHNMTIKIMPSVKSSTIAGETSVTAAVPVATVAVGNGELKKDKPFKIETDIVLSK